MAKKFDTAVQSLKYKVIREVARQAWAGTLRENILDIPKIIVPGKTPTMRCCIYKERAIVEERIKVAMGGDRSNPNIIEVIDIACDECPAAGYEITDSCRGCLAHRCERVCRKNAISFDANHSAHIDKTKCVECGECAKVCIFSAIINRKRPCMNACKAKAISISSENVALIDDSKCTQCGACVYQCPFGAIVEKSYILDVIEAIKAKKAGADTEIWAMVAPAIGSQFVYAKRGQIISAIKALGFDRVVETALGADLTALAESREISEKGFLMSSCCPSFVKYVRSAFPDLEGFLSENPSPMALLASIIKHNHPNAKVFFIGPCVAKKAEAQLDEVKPYVDAVITFEELQSLIDSRDIDVDSLPESDLFDASSFGRMFARSGGVTEAIKAGLREQNIDFSLNPMVCSGLDECRIALYRKRKNVLDANFIEGMACVGGCLNGAGCLSHGKRPESIINDYSREAVKDHLYASSDL